jgi:hypothetical protein
MADDFLNFTSDGSSAAPAAPAAAPASGDNDMDFLGGGSAAPAAQDDFFGGSSQPAAAPQDDFLGGGDASEPPPAQPPQDDFLAEPQAEPQAAPQAESVVEAQAEIAQPEEPAAPKEVIIPPLVKWEIANREAMEAKDSLATDNDNKIKKDASDVVKQQYAERTDLITANHQRATGAEAEFCKQRDALFATGQVWERVVSLIDVKAPSNEKKPQKVSRMRQLLLHMKNEAK